jgi:hypothetical protein
MIVRFEYERELPTQRLGDGLVDWVKPQYEIISGELNIESFLNQISREIGIKNIKILDEIK